MAASLNLVLAIHNHQPVGNFDGVFEQAYRDAYEPFLSLAAQFPQIPITMHNSGSLLEWLEVHHPEYIDRTRQFVARGQFEILGGPFYEPILAAIPRRDRIGQIKAYTQHLENLFQTRVRGMWVPERVWEPTFAGDIAAAGIEYTILDDSHFRWAGVSEDRLHGYFLTEDEGRLLKIFPDDEFLRYAIPWSDPEEAMRYLRGIAERAPGTVVSFGDDGEKFGSWPGTKEHVYDKGWLRRFLEAIVRNGDWLKVITLSQAVDGVAPQGKIYLPNASYREMTEWALPTEQQVALARVVKSHEKDADWPQLKPFVRAGFWRNFLVKYAEANDMYCRSREVSDRLEQAARAEAGQRQPELVQAAREDLYRGQCNCPYWHGAFGGLYLPHLRNAVYQHLISADTAVEQLAGRTGRWVHVEADDFNLDARKEIRMSGDRLVAYLSPARGGHLYELDVRSTRVNLLNTLNRRPEPYHQKVLDAGGHNSAVDDIAFHTHEGVRFKQPHLDRQIAYDRWPRKSLVDHFLRPDLGLEDFRTGNGGIGDFVLGVYETRLRQSSRRVETVMTRRGRVGDFTAEVTKVVALDAANGNQLEIAYSMQGLPPGQRFHFGVEFNFASMAAGAPDRYYYSSTGRQLGQLQTIQSLEPANRIGLVDEWLGLDVSLDLTNPAGIWTFPIQTVSQSEGGFELVHQSSTVVPHWEFIVDPSGRWSTRIQLNIDTSVAHARELAELSAARV